MKKSKKGVTLVELIICCFIIVMLGGACTALLMSGEHIYSTSASAAGAQLDSDVLQTYMMKLVPAADGITIGTEPGADENGLFFDDEGVFTIATGDKLTTIDSVSEFTYSLVKAGDGASGNARVQLVYTVTMNDDSEFTGGFILSNVKYDADTMGSVVDMSLAPVEGVAGGGPICFVNSAA